MPPTASADTASSTAHAARRGAEGNPLAAGVIAFGLGWLVSSLLPASQKEREVAPGQGPGPARAPAGGPAGRPGAAEVKENLREPAQQAAQSVKETATDAASTVQDEAKSAASDVKGEAQDAGQQVRQQAPSGEARTRYGRRRQEAARSAPPLSASILSLYCRESPISESRRGDIPPLRTCRP